MRAALLATEDEDVVNEVTVLSLVLGGGACVPMSLILLKLTWKGPSHARPDQQISLLATCRFLKVIHAQAELHGESATALSGH
jgi:hypothetical protein